MKLVVLEHVGESGNSPGGQGIHGSRTDAVHPDFSRTEAVRQIASACFQGCLRDTHDVVMGYDLFRPVIGHRNDTATRRHKWGRSSRQGDQGIGTDIMGYPECLPTGIQEISFQSILRSKGHAVQEKVKATKLFAQLRENSLDLAILGYVAGKDERVGTKSPG